MQIYLVRHGEAVERNAGIDDGWRWLTPKGRKTMVKVADRLRRQHVRPDLIITSPLTRAVQTAELLAAKVGSRAELRADASLLPARSVEQVLELIHSITNTCALMLVGHEPLLGQVAAELLGRHQITGLAKGSCLALELRDKPDKPVRLFWYAVPGKKISSSGKKLLEPVQET